MEMSLGGGMRDVSYLVLPAGTDRVSWCLQEAWRISESPTFLNLCLFNYKRKTLEDPQVPFPVRNFFLLGPNFLAISVVKWDTSMVLVSGA